MTIDLLNLLHLISDQCKKALEFLYVGMLEEVFLKKYQCLSINMFVYRSNVK